MNACIGANFYRNINEPEHDTYIVWAISSDYSLQSIRRVIDWNWKFIEHKRFSFFFLLIFELNNSIFS